MVRSHIITSSQPPPRQWPWTEAITGLRMSHGVISSATSSVSDSCQASALPRAGGAGRVGRDVVAGAEAPALGAQHHHAGGRVGVGLVEALDERAA